MAIYIQEGLKKALTEVGCTTDYNEYCQFVIEYSSDYYIQFEFTITGNIRICVIEKHPINPLWDNYKINWCIGNRWRLIPPLTNFIKAKIDAEELDSLPFNSQLKPLYLDLDFLQKIKKLGFDMCRSGDLLLMNIDVYFKGDIDKYELNYSLSLFPSLTPAEIAILLSRI